MISLFNNNVLGSYDKLAYDFKFKDLDGSDLNLSEYKDKVIIIVNVASQCGFTSQYEDMQLIWENYQKKGLVIVGVPSNDFGSQEPGGSQEIKSFCEVNYGINFPMTEKVKVKGENVHPFYAWAAQEVGFVGKPRWNFHKYLVDSNGELLAWFSSPTSPLSSKVVTAIERVLVAGSENAG